MIGYQNKLPNRGLSQQQTLGRPQLKRTLGQQQQLKRPGFGKKPMKGGLGPAKKPGPAAGAPPVSPPQQPPIDTLNDAGYNAAVSGAERDYGDTISGLDAKQYATQASFGFDPQFAANPYTRANLLTSAYNRSFNNTGNTYAARGQLYSGALDRARGFDANTYQQGLYGLRGEYDQQLAGLESDRLGAERERAGKKDSAYADMLERYLAKDPDSDLYADQGNPAVKGDKPKGKGGDPVKGNRGSKKKQPAFKRTGPRQKRPELDPGFTQPKTPGLKRPNYPKKKK